jgi:type IV pilus assembly protein PilP
MDLISGQITEKLLQSAMSEIVLREIVQDSAGEWIERQATLQLQETK